MTPRERVLAQIGHEETSPPPYTLSFETEDVMARLDGHFVQGRGAAFETGGPGERCCGRPGWWK